MTAEEDLDHALYKLHSDHRLTVHIQAAEHGVTWKATLSGEDFLDGEWTETISGTSTTHREAIMDVARSYYTRTIRIFGIPVWRIKRLRRSTWKKGTL